MTLLMSMLLGLIQGIAEFLPISSSGHLSLAQNLMGLVTGEDLFFDVLLHLGTLAAVCIVYWRDIVEMVVDFFAMLRALFTKDKTISPKEGSRLAMMIIVATLPLVLVVFIKKYVEALYGSTLFIGFALLLTGLLLFLSDRMQRGRKNARTATMLDALIVGLAQTIAVVPGLSRSGTTIAVGMLRGFSRKFAVRFSFLMSIPAILGAGVLEIGDAVQAGIDPKLIPIYLAGVLVATVAGFFAIKLVNLLVKQGKFGNFAYYCWAIGLIAIVATLIVK